MTSTSLLLSCGCLSAGAGCPCGNARPVLVMLRSARGTDTGERWGCPVTPPPRDADVPPAGCRLAEPGSEVCLFIGPKGSKLQVGEEEAWGLLGSGEVRPSCRGSTPKICLFLTFILVLSPFCCATSLPQFPPCGLAWHRCQLLLLGKTNSLPCAVCSVERGSHSACPSPEPAHDPLHGGSGAPGSLERGLRQGSALLEALALCLSHPVGRGREAALLDSLEKLWKEFMVPVLVSILSFHGCNATAAEWKKGLVTPGRNFCPFSSSSPSIAVV